MTELDIVLSALGTYLDENSVCAFAAYGTEPIEKYDTPVCALSVHKAKGAHAGFGEYLGVFSDTEHGERELYGKTLELELGIYIYVPKSMGANACNTVFSELTALLCTQQSPVRAGKISVEEVKSDRITGMFLTKAKAECTAFITYEMTDSGEFTDFRLGGRLV